MTQGVASAMLTVLALLAALLSYAFIKTALFLALLSAMAFAIFYYCLSPVMKRTLGYRPIIVALAMPLAAWGVPNIWALYAIMLGMVPLFARRAAEVAPLYLFSLLLLPGLDTSMMLGGVKLFEFGVHDALTVGALLRLLLFTDGKVEGFRPLDIPVLLVLLLLVTGLARDTTVTNFVRVLINIGLDYAVPYFVISRSVRTMDDVRLCMVWLACAAVIISVILLYEVRTGWPMYNSLYDRHGIMTLLLVKMRGGVLRAGGPFLESTSMAMVLVFCFLAAWLSRPAFRSKLHYLAILLLLLAGLSAPQSRGAWIGLLIAFLVADLYRGRIYLLLRRCVLVALAGGILLTLAHNSSYISETMGLSGGSMDTVDYRERLFERGMEEFKESPIVGYSLPEAMIRLDDLRQGEGIVDFVNTYIFIALISGVIGLIIFTGGFAIFIGLLWMRLPLLRRSPADLAPAALICGGLASMMEMLFFTSFGGRPAVFLFLFFGFSAAIYGMRGASRPMPAKLSAAVPVTARPSQIGQ